MTLRRHLERHEIEQIEQLIDDERNALFVRLLKYTGRRVSEALMLKPQDIIHDSKKILFIQLKKRGQKLSIPVDASAIYDELTAYIRINGILPNQFVFFSPYKGKEYHISKRRIEQVLKKAGDSSGIHAFPHAYRHSFAINLLYYLVKIRKIDRLDAVLIVQRIMGHSRIDTTLGYLPYIENDIDLKGMYEFKTK